MWNILEMAVLLRHTFLEWRELQISNVVWYRIVARYKAHVPIYNSTERKYALISEMRLIMNIIIMTFLE